MPVDSREMFPLVVVEIVPGELIARAVILRSLLSKEIAPAFVKSPERTNEPPEIVPLSLLSRVPWNVPSEIVP